jgi:peroxiredoxin
MRLRVLLLAAVCLVTACGSASAGATATPRVGARAGDVAPAVAGTTLEGHPVSLSAWHGSVVVVSFWASWCIPCQAEQPSVNTLARQEMPAGVHFLGVSLDVDAAAARSFISRYAVPYPSLLDASQTLVLSYEVAGPPTTFVIDGSGRVAAELVGELNVSDLRAQVAGAQQSS